MSEKYGNRCATYNIPLNSSENDIFRMGCAHFHHFLHINAKTGDWKPMMLKMHLELDDSPSIGEAEQRCIEHNDSNYGWRQSVQQLQEEIKALKDALLQTKENDVVNRIDKAPDVDNNATQELNSKKQTKNENKLNGEHNDTENVASASEEHHTITMPEEKPDFIDLRENCVYIENFKCSDSSLEKAFRNIRKLANEMNVEIPYDSVIHIDVIEKPKNCLDYYVYFCNAGIKKEFLKNRNFLIYHPETSPVRIFDYSHWDIVNIKNVESSDLSLETAYANVIRIAEKMEISDREIRDYIDHIDVFSTNSKFLTYSVQFKSEYKKDWFLRTRDKLKKFPETKSLEISDAGGHKLICDEIIYDDLPNTIPCTNVIGLAALFGMSLTPDDFKRICILNHHSNCVKSRGLSLIVEFSSKQVKDEFLEKKHKLEIFKILEYGVPISDINAKKNVVSIKYNLSDTSYITLISFIGLAKLLGCSLNPDQINYFFFVEMFIETAIGKK